MNKKVIIILIIFFVAILACGSVSATTLANKNFDNHFMMNIPDGESFEKEDLSTHEDGLYQIDLNYANDNIVIEYIESPLYSENSSVFFIQTLFEAVNSDLPQCYESQEGNLIILEPKTVDETHFPIVGLSSGNKTVIIIGDDVELLKEMGHSIEFS